MLGGTAAWAVHARLRLIPILTALAIAFVVAGALIRLGGVI